MSWKDILVVATSADRGAVAVKAAAALAKRLDATLHVCVPSVAPNLGAVDLPISSEMIADIMAEVRVETGRTFHIFAEAAAPSGAKMVQQQLETNELALAGDVAALAQIVDAVVVAQPARHHKISGANAILEGALFGSGRPVLMLPETVSGASLGSRILVGWKPSREAARALHDALPILRIAESVRLYFGSDASIGSDEYTTRIAAVAEHLRRHGVRLADADQKSSPRGVGILEAAKIWGADLVVMGAYGHSRLQERVFGGATEDAIRNSRLPIFFSH